MQMLEGSSRLGRGWALLYHGLLSTKVGAKPHFVPSLQNMLQCPTEAGSPQKSFCSTTRVWFLRPGLCKFKRNNRGGTHKNPELSLASSSSLATPAAQEAGVAPA